MTDYCNVLLVLRKLMFILMVSLCQRKFPKLKLIGTRLQIHTARTVTAGLKSLEEIVILSHDIDADSSILYHVNSDCYNFNRVYLPSKEVFYRLFSLNSIEYWCNDQNLPDIYIDGVCYDRYEIMELFSHKLKKAEEEIVIDYNKIAKYYEENKKDWLEKIKKKKS